MSQSTYEKLCKCVAEKTEITLPKEAPTLNKEVLFERPFSVIYPEGHRTGTMIFNGEMLSIYLSSCPNIAMTSNEDHIFSMVNDENIYFKTTDNFNRQIERQTFLRQFYQALLVSEQTPEYLASCCGVERYTPEGGAFVDWSPDGICFGELRQDNDERFYQPFYSLFKDVGSSELKALRTFDKLSVGCKGGEPKEPCFSVHRKTNTKKVVFTVGFCNALKVLKDFPECSVIEAYQLSHIKPLINQFNDYLHKDSPPIVALDTSLLNQFTALNNDKDLFNINKSEVRRCWGQAPLYMPIDLGQSGINFENKEA